ncbi:MAG TPA: FeoB-associated Cys-rich membrane protein [Candidatus Merdivicinus excrementipullorum]|uniref:FeoB-associated Cys-rich membrane protein n=1 Tax=Candidatus Merdivicinus excrementipullorum TaxID=2840867 RepID=A0A9D1JZR8_9FIRM|nr:FeoB-associated Cys-rich membrane protein [Candidatus Merdivicinus excrementipullorum]
MTFADVILILLIAAAVAAVVISARRRKKRGMDCCGSCSGCSGKCACPSADKSRR